MSATKEKELDFKFPKTVSQTVVEMDREACIEALKYDADFFINFYMGDELTWDVPDFHKDNWYRMTSVVYENEAIAWPRGHAKTTLAKLASVYFFLFEDTRFCVYLSSTRPISSAACADIISFFNSPNHIAVFGEPDFEIEQASLGYYVFTLKLPVCKFWPNGLTKKCILRAQGARQQVRGLNINNQRPDLAIADDFEAPDDIVDEKVFFKKNRDWFFGPFRKALTGGRKKILYIGNLLNGQCLLAHFIDSKFWHSTVYAAITEEGEPLWPDLWPLTKLKKDFQEYVEAGMVSTWFAEMLNIPILGENGLIDLDDITYGTPPNPGECSMVFITVDPAISKKTWADESGVVVHGFFEGKWYALETFHGKVSPEQLYEIIELFANKWNVTVVGVEAAAMQKVLHILFQVLAATSNSQLEFFEIPHANVSKTERLAAWCTLLRKGEYILPFNEMEIPSQLAAYDTTKLKNKDDLIDACSMVVPMLANYMDEIISKGEILSMFSNIRGEYEVATC